MQLTSPWCNPLVKRGTRLGRSKKCRCRHGLRNPSRYFVRVGISGLPIQGLSSGWSWAKLPCRSRSFVVARCARQLLRVVRDWYRPLALERLPVVGAAVVCAARRNGVERTAVLPRCCEVSVDVDDYLGAVIGKHADIAVRRIGRHNRRMGNDGCPRLVQRGDPWLPRLTTSAYDDGNRMVEGRVAQYASELHYVLNSSALYTDDFVTGLRSGFVAWASRHHTRHPVLSETGIDPT